MPATEALQGSDACSVFKSVMAASDRHSRGLTEAVTRSCSTPSGWRRPSRRGCRREGSTSRCHKCRIGLLFLPEQHVFGGSTLSRRTATATVYRIHPPQCSVFVDMAPRPH
jgi:hypothetical protein